MYESIQLICRIAVSFIDVLLPRVRAPPNTLYRCIFFLSKPSINATIACMCVEKPTASVLGKTLRICIEAVFVKRRVVKTPHMLDNASVEYGGSFSRTSVECVKLVTRLTPFLFAMIPYWVSNPGVMLPPSALPWSDGTGLRHVHTYHSRTRNVVPI
jgi:hypothetical protein